MMRRGANRERIEREKHQSVGKTGDEAEDGRREKECREDTYSSM